MTNYTRFATDRPHEWRLVDLDNPSTSPAITVEGDDVQADEVAAALNATAAAPDLRLALGNVEAILAEACSSPYDEEWELISDAWSYVKAILAGETLVETESKTAAEILGLPWDDHDPATEIEAAASAMGYAEVFGEDGTL